MQSRGGHVAEDEPDMILGIVCVVLSDVIYGRVSENSAVSGGSIVE